MNPSWLAVVVLAVIFFWSAIVARPLVGLNLWIYKKLGLQEFATFWERQLGWWITTVRVICTIGAVVFLLKVLALIGRH